MLLPSLYSSDGSGVNNLPANAGDLQKTRVRFLGQEDPLEKEMANHSCILGLENPMDGGAWRAIAQKVAVRHD